jgi:nucleotide-binding universal stress UspA family protein
VGYAATGPSRRALLWAATEAERRGATLTVITVVDRALLAGSPPAGMAHGWLIAWERSRHRAVAGAALASTVAPMVHVEAVAEVGSPRELLVSASRRAELTVLGQSARRGGPRGAVVEAVAKHGSGPLMILGARRTPRRRADRAVVVGVDGSPEASAALDFAASSAAAERVPLRVVCVAGRPLTVLDGQASSLAAAAQVAQDAVAHVLSAFPDLRLSGLAVEGEAAEILARQTGGSRLLVVGRRGSGAHQTVALGTVSSALLRAAPSSLAVVGVPKREPDLPTARSARLPIPRAEVVAG